jgi:activator-of-BECN1-regulated-autophagy protein 1
VQVYRVVDMELVRVLPSVEDEVNVACFHPQVGGGLVYGTKEGKLRILVHDRSSRLLNPHQGLEDELVEVYLAFQENRSFRGLTVKILMVVFIGV